MIEDTAASTAAAHDSSTAASSENNNLTVVCDDVDIQTCVFAADGTAVFPSTDPVAAAWECPSGSAASSASSGGGAAHKGRGKKNLSRGGRTNTEVTGDFPVKLDGVDGCRTNVRSGYRMLQPCSLLMYRRVGFSEDDHNVATPRRSTSRAGAEGGGRGAGNRGISLDFGNGGDGDEDRDSRGGGGGGGSGAMGGGVASAEWERAPGVMPGSSAMGGAGKDHRFANHAAAPATSSLGKGQLEGETGRQGEYGGGGDDEEEEEEDLFDSIPEDVRTLVFLPSSVDMRVPTCAGGNNTGGAGGGGGGEVDGGRWTSSPQYLLFCTAREGWLYAVPEATPDAAVAATGGGRGESQRTATQGVNASRFSHAPPVCVAQYRFGSEFIEAGTSERDRERERERERERRTEREREQTERERQADRQGEGETETEKDREGQRHRV